MPYFVFLFEDNDVHSVEKMCRKEFERRIKNNHYGENVRFATRFPRIVNECNEYFDAILVMKGEIIIPKIVDSEVAYSVISNTGLSGGRPAERPQSSEPPNSSKP